MLRFIIISQYLTRLVLVFPLTTQVGKAIGFVIETAWIGAAYNLVLYLLAVHVSNKKVMFNNCTFFVHLAC